MLVVCAVMLPSCAKRQSHKEHTVVGSQEVDHQKLIILDKVVQQEAMLVTIPIPLYDERILPSSLDFFENETIALGYKSPLTVQQSVDFFIGQMERYGWKHIVSFESDDTFLFFENPGSYSCVVIKASEKYGSSIFIYVRQQF